MVKRLRGRESVVEKGGKAGQTTFAAPAFDLRALWFYWKPWSVPCFPLFPALTTSLNAARATNSYERRLLTLARVPLLIIDDFGLKPLPAPADEDLNDLIAERGSTRELLPRTRI